MSYINRKGKLFNVSGDGELVKKRSDGRMKTYRSATDARAWCNDSEERRQYILECVSRREQGKSLSLGKYIPIEAIIDILLANKNADIQRLEKEIKDLQNLLDSYSKLLTPDQQNQIHNMKIRSGYENQDATSTKMLVPPRNKTFNDYESSELSEVEKGDNEVNDKEKDIMNRSLANNKTNKSKSSNDEPVPSYNSDEKVPYGTSNEPVPYGTSDEPVPYTSDEDDEVSNIINRDAEMISMKNALMAKDALCEEQHRLALAAIEQLENIKDIIDDKEQRNPQKSLNSIRNNNNYSPQDQSDSCKSEIEALEREIEQMRKNNQTPEQEAEILNKELEVLKKYCLKLSKIQTENVELKKERDQYKSKTNTTNSSSPAINSDDDDPSNLKSRIEQLEQQLSGCKAGQYHDTTDFSADNDNLYQRLDNLQGLEDEVAALKRRCKDSDELKQKMNKLNSSTLELETMKGKCNESDNKMSCLQSECSRLQCKINEMDQEMNRLKCKSKEAEALKLEKQCLKMRLEELACIQADFEDLLQKTRGFDKIKADCIKYKMKYEELLNVQCECDSLEQERNCLKDKLKKMECCISSQEQEINELVGHIECLTKGRDEQQNRTKETLMIMRADLEKKDNLITIATQKLDKVQDQLSNSIEDVSCEMSCLHMRIHQLENQLDQSNAESLQSKSKDSSCICVQTDEYKTNQNECDALKEELESLKAENLELKTVIENKPDAPMKGDKHLRQIMKQTKCAVEKVTETLEKHQNAEMNREKKDEEKPVVEDSETINGLKSKISQLEERIGNLENLINNLQTNLKETEHEKLILKQEKSKLEEEKSILEESFHELQPAMDENKELKKMSSQIQDIARKEVSKLELNNQELIDENARMKADLELLLQQLKELETEKDNLENLMTETGADGRDVLNAEIDRLRFELDQQKQDCEDKMKLFLKQHQIKSDLVLEKARSEIMDLQGNLTSNVTNLSARNLQLEDQINNLQKENAALKKELAALKEQLEKGKGEGSKDTKSTFSKERDDLLKQIDDQKDEINDLLNKIKQLSSRTTEELSATNNKELEEERKNLEKERKEKENLQSIIRDLENQLKNLSKKTNTEGIIVSDKPHSDNVASVTNELTSKLEQEENRANTAEDLLKKCKNNEEYLKSQISDLQKQIADLQNKDKQVVADNNDNSNNAIDDYQLRIKNLEAELDKQKKDCNNMISQLNEKYDKDIKTVQNQNRASIAMLQKSKEDLIKDINAEHDKAMNNMQNELRQSKIELKTVMKGKKKLPEKIVEEEEEPHQQVAKEKKLDDKVEDERKKSMNETKQANEEVRKKSLTMETFQDVCICGKFPVVIAISALPSETDLPSNRSKPLSEPYNNNQHRQFDSNILQKCVDQCTKQCGGDLNKSVAKESNKACLVKRLEDVEKTLLLKQQTTQQKVELLQNKVCELRKNLEIERHKTEQLKDTNKCQSKVVATMREEMSLIKNENKEQLHQFKYVKASCQLKLEQDKYRQLEYETSHNRQGSVASSNVTPKRGCECIMPKSPMPRKSRSPSTDKQRTSMQFYTELRNDACPNRCMTQHDHVPRF